MKSHTNRSSQPSRMSVCFALALAGAALFLPACQSTNKAAWQVQPTLKMVGAQSSIQSAEAYYRLGRYHDGQNRFAQAENDYRKAIQDNPAHAEAMNALGVLLARQGRLQDAISILEGAAGIEPQRSHILSNLGYAWQLAGDVEKAIHCLEKALDLDPRNARAAKNLEVALDRREAERGGLASAEGLGSQSEIQATSPVSDKPVVARTSVLDEKGMGVKQEAVAEAAPEALSAKTSPTPPPELNSSFPEAKKSLQQPGEPLDSLRPDPAIRPYRLEITNGMGMDGAARRLRNQLRQEGEPKARVTDLRPFRNVQTRIEFEPGHEDQAKRLAERLGGVVVASKDLFEARSTHLRVVIGKDLKPLILALPKLAPRHKS